MPIDPRQASRPTYVVESKLETRPADAATSPFIWDRKDLPKDSIQGRVRLRHVFFRYDTPPPPPEGEEAEPDGEQGFPVPTSPSDAAVVGRLRGLVISVWWMPMQCPSSWVAIACTS